MKFSDHSNRVPIIMYGNAKVPLQEYDDAAHPVPYNAFGRVKRKETRVMIFIARDITKQKLRMQVNEHLFGTVKHYADAGYFLSKGKAKVSAEVALMYLSCNIRRAMKLAGGAQGLILPFYHFTKLNSIACSKNQDVL